MELSESEKQIILNHWSFLAEMTLDPTIQGASNTTYFVYTQTRQFVLKIYSATTEASQIYYEHSLLAFLQQTDLPFSIPVPIPASSGETIIKIETDQRSLRVALLPRLVGQAANRRNLQQIESIGFALAELHKVLAEFDPEGQFAKLPYWGDLARIHPLVSNPFNIAQVLDVSLEEQTFVSRMLTDVMEAVPRLYAKLPIQTIHADYITPNILINNDRVIGILDFEFATRDLRLLDYLSSLDQLASFPWREELFEEIIRAFSTGYRERNSLVTSELQAAIMVWRLQRASSLVYWTGWLLEGKASRQSIMDALIETLKFETWLEKNGEKLLDYLSFG